MPGPLSLNIGSLRKLTLPAIALLVAIVVAVSFAGTSAAPSPPGDEITLVNAGRKMVEGKEEGRCIAAANHSLAGSHGTTYSGNSPDATPTATGLAGLTSCPHCSPRCLLKQLHQCNPL